MSPRLPLSCLSLVTVLGVPAASSALTPGQTCERVASQALRSCVRTLARQHQRCYQETGSPCPAAHPKVVAALAAVEAKVLGKCSTQATVTQALYSPALTPGGLADRLQEACGGAVASLAARSYGGPHGAARAAATETDQSCLDRAWTKGRSLIDDALRQQSGCVRKVHRGGVCNGAGVAAKLGARETSTAAQIVSRCPAALETLVAVDAPTFVARAAAQARCLVATAHGDTGPLVLDCGPRAAVPVPPRATPTQVVLPSATWGTRCGNGSDYAFWLRLAPTGFDVGKVVVYMQGGGACYNDSNCSSQSPGLFEALGDPMAQGGVMSSTASTNPFRDWTKVYLPYCTQDLHIGGGVTNVFPSITVHRYGGLNVRAAMRWVRDVLWAEMDASDPEGYRGDRVVTFFSGGSAGGYGAAYNYHWVMDDLAWPHTSSAPDAALAMDNGGAGVIALGAVVLSANSPGWNTRPLMPPYCFTPFCQEIFVNLEVATAPRLLGVPEQQFLHVTNQIDNVQQGTTLFPSTAAFVNTLRTSYCGIQGTPGLHSFLFASSSSLHTLLLGGTYNTATIGGTVLRDWLGDAMATPGAVIDKTDIGTLEADYSGVGPFPCTVGSPSAAFLDDPRG